MLYLAIPAHNEVATIGVLLWRLRTVLAEFPREYEVVVYDDASTDETAEVAEQYERAMPVKVLRGREHLGYAGATDALLRHIAQATRYPRRDAVLLLQGDFTDPPVMVPEFARRFEGGADLVVGERTVVADAPVPVKRLFKAAHWAMRPFVRVDQVRDLTASMRLVRIAALRDALRAAGNGPFLSGDSWTANADLLLHLAPYARRVESVPMEPTYGVRMRETRRVAMRDGLAVLKWAWQARRRRAVVGSETEGGDDRRGREEQRGSRRREDRREDRRHDRRDEPELSVERLREKVREREGTRGLDGAPPPESRRERQRNREREAIDPAAPDRGGPERPTERSADRSSERSSRRERPAERQRPVVAADLPLIDPAEPPTREPRTPRAPRARKAEERTTEPRPAERAPQEVSERRTERGIERTPERANERPATTRSGRRDESPRMAADAALELDDPFAPPPPRRDRLEQVLDVREARENREISDVRRDRSSAASDAQPVESDAPITDAFPTQGDDQDTPAAAIAKRAVTDDRPVDDGSGEEPSDAMDAGALDEFDADAEADAEMDADGDQEDAPRKRRRNRRSRRGRRRRGASGNGEEGATDGDIPSPAGDGDDADLAATNDVEDDAVDGLAEEYEQELTQDLGQRPRRRGRRGRRGGARRSRGRRERGDGESEGGPEQDGSPEGDFE
ncbi:glycosyltransferase [Gemmatimonas aurantiaca]|uniref:glycosyltransferase n=1 Tax=Gemmatimonas aurantiaca TaxID=173480 RepID=UPI00301D472E